MVRRSICALLLAAPLSMMLVGCSSFGMKRDLAARRAQSAPTSHTARLMNLAERYEQQGNQEGALRLYQQVVQAEPGHRRAQQRIAAMAGGQPTQRPATNHTLVAELAPEPASPANSPDPARTASLAAHVPAIPPAAPPMEADVPEPPAEPALAALPDVNGKMPRDETPPFDVTIVPDPAFADVSEPSPFPEPEPGQPTAPELTAEWWADTAQTEALASPFEEAAPAVEESPAEWSRTSLARLCEEAPVELRGLIHELEAADPAQRKAALTELAIRGASAAGALPAIQALLSDPDVLVQVHAAWAIWEVSENPQDSIDPLVELLVTDTDSHVVQASAYFLGSIGADAAIATDALWYVCDRTTGITRLHAAEALACIAPDDQAPVAILIDGLSDADQETRWLAALALSSVSVQQQSAAVTALTAALSDISPEVRTAAALTLGGFGNHADEAVSELHAVSDSDDEGVRTAARIALECITK